MNGYSSSFSDGEYFASASSEFGAGEVAYAAFDYVFNDCCSFGWTAHCYDNGPDSGQYNGYTNGIYSGSSTTTLANGTQLRGAWLQLQMPAAIVLQHYVLYAGSTDMRRGPRQFVVSGSNDGAAWSVVDSQDGVSGYVSGEGKSFPVLGASSFSYFRVSVSQNNYVGTGQGSWLSIREWQLFRGNVSNV